MAIGTQANALRAVLAAALVAAIAAPAAGRAGEGDAAPGRRRGSEAPAWEWGPSVLLYLLPGETDYLQPTLTVDRGALHLEARYNYEDRETGSALVGWNLSFGEELKFGLTPMVGRRLRPDERHRPGAHPHARVGPARALVPERVRLRPRGLVRQSFFYAWSELSVTGPDWLRVGAGAAADPRLPDGPPRSREARSWGSPFWKLSATAYLFAPGQDDQFVVVAVAGSF